MESEGPTPPWRWAAQNLDGTVLHEVGDDGAERGWESVALDDVVAVHLFPTLGESAPHHHHAVWIDLAAGERAVFLRRRAIPIQFGDKPVLPEMMIHVLGVERPDGCGAYVALYEDGSTIHTTNREAI